MINTLLFDLDGTLLDLDQEYFLNRYFQAMVDYARDWDYHDGKYLVDSIWQATEQMILNINPELSNEQVFMNHFLPLLKCDPERIRAFFESFYDLHFPRLAQFCGVYPAIPGIVEQAFARGYTIIVATNPVFPARAQQERLDWAGVGHFPFKLVTSYENMHFCKPQPQYYLEIAAFAGVAPESCLMIGNDTREDLVASTVGMRTFLLKDGLIDRGDGFHMDYEGHMDDLRSFIEALPVLINHSPGN